MSNDYDTCTLRDKVDTNSNLVMLRAKAESRWTIRLICGRMPGDTGKFNKSMEGDMQH